MMNPQEALNYFGLAAVAELEDLVVEFGIDAETDEDGELVWIDGNDTREALFELHKRTVGHRPDDPAESAKEAKRQRDRESAAHRRRTERRSVLEQRVNARKTAKA